MDNIKKYMLGNPIETEAAVYEIEAAKGPCP